MSEAKSLKRALTILDLYTVDAYEHGVNEVAAKINVSKGTASRLMYTLASINILNKNHETRKYRLGNKLLQLAIIYTSNIDLKIIVAPFLRDLNNKTNELVIFHVIKGDKRFCVDWIESTELIRHVIEKEHIYGPLHAGSPGKLLLAYLPDKEVDGIIHRVGLPRFTQHTITDRKTLKNELLRIRKDGLSTSTSEFVEHASTVSAPVRNMMGQVIGALSISWIVMGNTSDKLKNYSVLVKNTANKISEVLGYRLID